MIAFIEKDVNIMSSNKTQLCIVVLYITTPKRDRQFPLECISNTSPFACWHYAVGPHLPASWVYQ